jgi:hypothetical protein
VEVNAMAAAEINQIIYRGATRDDAGRVAFGPTAASFRGGYPLQMWHGRLERRLGGPAPASSPSALFYSTFDEDAALVHRSGSGAPEGRDAVAHVLIGPATLLTPRLALGLRDWVWAPNARSPQPPRPGSSELPPLSVEELTGAAADLTVAARSQPATDLLAVALSRVLAGTGTGLVLPNIVLPNQIDPYAVLWGLQDVLTLLAEGANDADRWRLSFDTHEVRPSPPAAGGPGLFVAFRQVVVAVEQEAEPPKAVPVSLRAAKKLVETYAASGIAGLRLLLHQARVFDEADLDARTARFTAQWSSAESSGGSARTQPATRQVTCPICLSRLSWGDLPLHQYDRDLGRYVPLEIPSDASPEQYNRAMRTAAVRCPDPGTQMSEHYLPASYGMFGPPVVLGLVGATDSGKTHLLAAMIGAIERHGLSAYGASALPVDLARHDAFLRESVRPLLRDSVILASTREGVVSFVDALLISEGDGLPRPVALFDVAGEDLRAIDDAKQFLDVADGLIFVVDPSKFDGDRLGDQTFNTVLNLIQASGRLAKVSAAIVINKADLVRFDDPIAHWLRLEDDQLDPEQILSESADVYAYLVQRGAQAWTRPFRDCHKATLHVASATGGPRSPSKTTSTYPRGVAPRRVLGPLVALLAMTGVLTSPEAQEVGV